jgi:hypothetical protein
MSPISIRRTFATLLVATLAALTVLLPAGAANAANYRFWGYYTWSDGSWAFATKGPDQTTPADGSVEGWRFAVSPASGDPRPPRAAGDFETICADTESVTGKKRVAVVIDAGLSSEAPSGAEPPKARGACAQVDESASGAQVLAAVAESRAEKGLVCGIDGYPATGCGEPVDAAAPTKPDAPVELALAEETPSAQQPSDEGGTPWTGIAIGAVVVAGLGGAALWRVRSQA